MPLFEAVVNSIQAIEDRKHDGTIHIRIIRDQSQTLYETEKSSREIIGFEVEDNGIGFNDENFNAFSTSDTTYKVSRGGKGVGRFVWLVAFDEVDIESTFQASDGYKTRTFKFVPRGDGVEGNNLFISDSEKVKTIVKLRGFKERFRGVAPKKIETIGAFLVEHCLEYLIRPEHPTLILSDASSGETVDLNDLFQKEMGENSRWDKFKAGGYEFSILHVRLYSSHIKDHQLHFCANNRVVKSEKLFGKIPNLARIIADESGKEFIYAAYLDGKMLDETVNQERTDFTLSSEEGSIFEGPFTWSQLRSAANEQINLYLNPFTASIQQRKDARLLEFVSTHGPMYRPILKYLESDLALLDPEVDDGELDLRLYKALHSLQERLREEGAKLLGGSAPDTDFGVYAKEFDEYFSKISDVNQSDLARYVFDRKLVLQFLQKLLAVQTSGNYSLEDKIHNLIFPMGETSNDVLFDRHNLWLVDERLAYHRYLASDKQLRKTGPLDNSSKKELDLVIFDAACAFIDTSTLPFQTITIVEFKRPMRTSYTDSENPFSQILTYIDKIRDGKAVGSDGRPIPVSDGVLFYCYIVADITERLEHYAYQAELDKTPDGQGFAGYKKHYKAYFEVVSYTKLVEIAKQRNHAFFEHLGLPLVVKR